MLIYLAKIKTKPMGIEENFNAADREIKKAIAANADIVILPCAFLTGYNIGILAGAGYAEKLYGEKVEKLAKQNPNIPILADGMFDGDFYRILYNVPADEDELFRDFEVKGVRFSVLDSSDASYLSAAATDLPNRNPDCIILDATKPAVAGSRLLLHRAMQELSAACGVPCIADIGGWGDCSYPDFHMPVIGVVDDKKDIFTATFKQYLQAENCYKIGGKFAPTGDIEKVNDIEFKVEYNQNPLVPAEFSNRDYCLDLFEAQTLALAARLDNINAKTAVIGLSGGLDSALALLVTANAFDLLGRDRKGIYAVSMPGFGTSQTTRDLSKQLADSLGIDLKVIDITAACKQALKDIGHDGVTPDVTFENVQARMRTLNCLNIANMTGGIMIGTGDLSEEAMGFATYGGDRLASYNINSSVSKTVIRTMLPYVTRLENLKAAKEAVKGILNIPVSPELIPHGGEILQKTEDILAPYKLIDFYIYCFVVANVSPAVALKKAQEVFAGEFTPEYLKEKARMFYKKFVAGQFKRSAAPEGADITHGALTRGMRYLPSDGSAEIFEEFL